MELLAAQIEEADVAVVNKGDLASSQELEDTVKVVRALRPAAKVLTASFGALPLTDMLPMMKEQDKHTVGASPVSAGAGVVGDEDAATTCCEPECTDPTHDHSHHSHSDDDDDADACADVGCTDPTHDHSHSYSHGNHGDSLAAENLGITNFVYRADRPFSESRLLNKVLLSTVVVLGLSIDSLSPLDSS